MNVTDPDTSTGAEPHNDPATATCPGCGGDGVDDMDESMACPLCEGEGVIDATEADTIRNQWTIYGRAANPFSGMLP